MPETGEHFSSRLFDLVAELRRCCCCCCSCCCVDPQQFTSFFSRLFRSVPQQLCMSAWRRHRTSLWRGFCHFISFVACH